MTPPDDSAEQPSAKPPHRFPEGLEFLNSFRKAEQTEDPEMRMAILSTLLDNVRNRTELLRAHGLDPDKLIDGLETLLKHGADLARLDKEVEEYQENLLQLMANKVDAARAMVDRLEEFVKAAAEERPFDPQVEEAREMLEEIRKVYPKID
jgi:CII-binding regulator of phage lambda lysogenization HflD